MVLTIVLLSFAGFGALALSQHRHHREVFGLTLRGTDAVALRVAGGTLLGLSFVLAASKWGITMGLTAWLGVATPAVLAITMAITYRPNWLGTLQRVSQQSIETRSARRDDPSASQKSESRGMRT